MDPTESPGREGFATALGAWFDERARDLPWRRNRTPYGVWVSEIMLQQTRVDTVVPYYERFRDRFPDAASLADAPIDSVLELWSGLGYYRRARQLHLAAKEILARHGGALPSEVDELRALPGIGPYTAGAIASIAYGKRAALVDGNVARVLARVLAIEASITQPATQKKLWAAATAMVPEDRPGRFNEAMMELGATVCTPTDPRCEACPVLAWCRAKREGSERRLPVVAPKAKVPVVEVVALVAVAEDGSILFGQRAGGGLFGGLWEPPMAENVSDTEKAAAALGVDLGGSWIAAGKVTRLLSHRRMVISVFATRAANKTNVELRAPYAAAAWLDAITPGVGVSTLARKVITCALTSFP